MHLAFLVCFGLYIKNEYRRFRCSTPTRMRVSIEFSYFSDHY